jgi:hypothetical protein
MRFPETFRNSRCMDALRGVCVLLDIFYKASYLNYCEGVIVCPAAYGSLVLLSSYGFRFSYQKEFSFVGPVEFILTIRVDDIMRRIFEVVPKNIIRRKAKM